MSDHRVAPVAPKPTPAPTPAHETPYYAVVFTSVRTDEDGEGYARTAERLSELVQSIPGFLGEDSAHTPGGLAISVAYFRDLAGIDAWRHDARHREAKQYGREHWYERYSIHIARVEHSHGFTRRDFPGAA
ncbi:antibiotic biosynthesis monooxygenase family protein [Streptomyces sp. NPDC054794]